MQIFYSTLISENQIVLLGDEFNHCKNVLRLKIGDLVKIADGKGNFYNAKIENYTKDKAELLKLNASESDSEIKNYSLHIAIAPTKNIDRIEWFVEKSVEIGVDQISFITSKRSERKVINIERIEKIAISAMKQSGKAWLPAINPIQPFEKFVKQDLKIGQKFIAHLVEGEERKELKDWLTESLTNQNPAQSSKFSILIGPEGDFTAEEVKLALENKYLPASLGNSRLRTETAGVMACATFAIIFN